MDAVGKALWYIEMHFSDSIGLEEIAGATRLSRFHLSRVFAQTTGLTVSSYLRGRRLTVAARKLAEGASDILSVALDVGYGSHEAFTRAFRDQFATTPEAVRASGNVNDLPLVEPLTMPNRKPVVLPEPVLEEKGPYFFAGIREFKRFVDRAAIPEQWQRFVPHVGATPGQIGRSAYGVCLSSPGTEDGFDYLSSVQVKSLDRIPEGLSGVRIDRRRYARFAHAGHVSTIGATCAAIFETWQPPDGLALQHDPMFLIEHYDETFDGTTGLGGMEVWVPIG